MFALASKATMSVALPWLKYPQLYISEEFDLYRARDPPKHFYLLHGVPQAPVGKPSELNESFLTMKDGKEIELTTLLRNGKYFDDDCNLVAIPAKIIIEEESEEEGSDSEDS